MPDIFADLQGVLDDFETDSEADFQDRPDLKPALDGFVKWVNDSWQATQSLQQFPDSQRVRIGDSAQHVPREVRADLLNLPILRPYLDKLVAEHGIDLMREASSRVLAVLPIIVSARLTPPAEHYLNRVGLLYLWGFDAETPILARSVLESALEARVTDERVREVMKGRGKTVRGKYVSLGLRIEVAHQLDVLDRHTKDLADDIREAGNDILHSAPKPGSSISSSLDAIRVLGVVLARLFPGDLEGSA